MSVIKKTLAELKEGDVLVNDRGREIEIKYIDKNIIFEAIPGHHAFTVDYLIEISFAHTHAGICLFNVKAPESAEPEPQQAPAITRKSAAEIKSGDIVVDHRGQEWICQSKYNGSSLYLHKKESDPDGEQWVNTPVLLAMGVMNPDDTFNTLAKPVKPELKPGSWVAMGDVPEGQAVLVPAIKEKGELLADLRDWDALVLIPPTIQTVGAHKSGDIVRLGDLPVGTRIVAAVRMQYHLDELTKVNIAGDVSNFCANEKVELA